MSRKNSKLRSNRLRLLRGGVNTPKTTALFSLNQLAVTWIILYYLSMMKTTEEIKEKIRQHKPFLQNQFRMKKIGLFGSYARGKQGKDSDVDLLVEFSEPVGFFTFLGLEEYLEKLLKKEVDLVTKNALKPGIGKYILQEASYV